MPWSVESAIFLLVGVPLVYYGAQRNIDAGQVF